MFKIITLFLFNNRECFDGKLDQRKAAKSDVPNVTLLKEISLLIASARIDFYALIF